MNAPKSIGVDFLQFITQHHNAFVLQALRKLVPQLRAYFGQIYQTKSQGLKPHRGSADVQSVFALFAQLAFYFLSQSDVLSDRELIVRINHIN